MRRPFPWALLRLTLLLVTLLSGGAGIAQENNKNKKVSDVDRVAQAYAQLVGARTEVLNYALALQRKYDPRTEEYSRGRDLYVDATKSWAEWSAMVVVAVEAGHAKNLNNDIYRSKALDAGKKTQMFLDYVEEKTAAPRGGFVDFATKLINIGLDIYNGTRSKQPDDRKSMADKFDAQGTKWPLWDEMSQAKKDDGQQKKD
jgi:hypothetical protein